jgi:hypothetical protein
MAGSRYFSISPKKQRATFLLLSVIILRLRGKQSAQLLTSYLSSTFLLRN